MKTALILGLSISTLAFAGQSGQFKVTQELNGLDSQSQVNVIVKWKSQPTADHDKKVTDRGGLKGSHLHSIRSSSYQLSASAATDLANDPEVEHISVDHPLRAKLDNTAGAINASAAWSAGMAGYGVGVAVIDSGISATKDLGYMLGSGSRIVYTQDFVNPLSAGGKMKGVYGQDQYGHGQHVAGIIAGNGYSSQCSSCTRTFIGAAPGANLIDLRVLDQNGSGSDSTVIAAIEEAIALQGALNIRVINLSLGRPVYESYQDDPLCQAVEQAWRAGIVVVVAAGNDGRDNSFGNFGYGTINAPGNDPFVITVGAMRSLGTPTRTDDLIASYSAKGPTQVDHIVKPDILAPGNLIVSLNIKKGTLSSQNPSNAVPVSYYQNGGKDKESDSYFTLSGTSMSAGVVSGAAADLIQANPTLTPDQVKLLLMQTAYKTFPTTSSVYDPASSTTFTSYYDIFTVGAGYLDLGAALSMVYSVPPGVNAQSPVAVYDQTTGLVTLGVDPSSVYASRTVWGQQGVWSSAVLSNSQLISDSRTVWGQSSNLSDTTTLFGTRTVWGQTAIYGNRTVWGQSGVDGTRTVWGQTAIEIQGEQ